MSIRRPTAEQWAEAFVITFHLARALSRSASSICGQETSFTSLTALVKVSPPPENCLIQPDSAGLSFQCAGGPYARNWTHFFMRETKLPIKPRGGKPLNKGANHTLVFQSGSNIAFFGALAHAWSNALLYPRLSNEA